MALALNVNSYVTTSEADVYFETRLETSAWDNATDEEQEAALVGATYEIDNNSFIGTVTDADQALSWPRSNAVYNDSRRGMVVSIPKDEIPAKIKRAVFEQALHALTNPDASGSSGASGKYESISVGSISISDSTSASSSKVPRVSRFASDFISQLVLRGASQGYWMAN